jgi:hypothetical protein
MKSELTQLDPPTPLERKLYNSPLFKATVYAQVGRPLPKPLSDLERGFEDGSPSLRGKGLGVRSGLQVPKS